MKCFAFAKSLAFLFGVALFVISCKKENHINKRAFKLATETWYRISPTAPIPLTINGIEYAGFAYFPGGGSGHATHMGNCNAFFNQLSYGTSAEAPPAGSVSAPINEVPGYIITGAPLPLIQAGDFVQLASLISELKIPTDLYGKIINHVVYNDKGDAIYLSAIDGSGGTFPISSTSVGFKGKALIVNGSGKFRNAVGEIDYEGYFNVTDANDAAYNAEGWIDY
jgi:hypothetical protein